MLYSNRFGWVLDIRLPSGGIFSPFYSCRWMWLAYASFSAPVQRFDSTYRQRWRQPSCWLSRINDSKYNVRNSSNISAFLYSCFLRSTDFRKSGLLKWYKMRSMIRNIVSLEIQDICTTLRERYTQWAHRPSQIITKALHAADGLVSRIWLYLLIDAPLPLYSDCHRQSHCH